MPPAAEGEGSTGGLRSTPLLAPPRYRDPSTAALGVLASEWDSLHRAYQAATLRAQHVADPALREVVEESARGSLALREAIGARMVKVLKKHPLYPWMAAHKGFPKAAHTARLLSTIGDPLRFPGRVCAERHHLPSDYEGDRCPLLVYGDGAAPVCGADVGPVRQGTGTRSLWHYCGLHVGEDGRFPRQRRGVQGDWNPSLRGALLMPDVGLAAQLIRQRVEPWRTVYDEAKERIQRERGVDFTTESERLAGPSASASEIEGAVDRYFAVEVASGRSLTENGGGVDRANVSVRRAGPAATDQEGGVETANASEETPGPALRPFQVEQRARIIAVKAMLGDLLAEWKRLAVEAA